VARGSNAGRLDIADIVRAHRAELEARYRLSSAQKRVLTDIVACRTETLGGHRENCAACGYERVVYLSCRNRHCPKCQGLAQEQWIEEQRQRTLNVKHFHVVFTLPAELRPLAAFAQRVVYGLLFQAVGRTLLEFGGENLKATLGATLVLHTWTKKLEYHPHIHAVVTAGGLSLDNERFTHCSPKFLFPVGALGKVFRAKVIEGLWDAHRSGAFAGFSAFDDPEGFARLINRLPRKAWYTYSKPSFGKGEHVLQYLGRYTHRVGLSNSRLVEITDEAITFRTRGSKTATVAPTEFVRRFVQHVLPSGFHKIRHVGLNASKERRALAEALLASPSLQTQVRSWQERLVEVNRHDTRVCPQCRAALVATPLPPIRRCRAPPAIQRSAA
jgi:Putative transposase/Transposase zinc-binding domain